VCAESNLTEGFGEEKDNLGFRTVVGHEDNAGNVIRTEVLVGRNGWFL
jgi:hypothetical protein